MLNVMDKIRSLWRSVWRREPRTEPKSVGLISGYFFNINFIVGTGFLSIPYAFYHAGTLTATLTLLALAVISWNSANWIVETMARSQAIISWKKSQTEINSDTDGFGSDDQDEDCLLLTANTAKGRGPNFTLLTTRKFEASEMCEIFFGRYMKYFYIVVYTVYMFFSFWANASVAGSAWATNLPLNFGSLSQCREQAFYHTLVPRDDGCLSAYRFCIMLFGLIVIPLSLVELTEQKHLQILLGLMRFLTFGCLIVYSVTNIISHPEYNPYNETAYYNGSFHSYGHQILKFDFNGWMVAIGIIVYAQILHSGIPSMTQPIKAKKWLGIFFGVLFISTTLLYLSLGVTMSLWFKESIEETGTLNFVKLAHHGSSTALRVMSYYIVLFPSLDVCSAYPLGVFALSNNLFVLITGFDTTELHQQKRGRLILIGLRLITAALPIIAALFIANLVYIVTYGGLLGLCICYLFPIMLQLRSQYICHKTFGEMFSSSSTVAPLPIDKELPLMAGRHCSHSGLRLKVKTYYTPYSNIFSHPFIVIVFGVVALVACGFIIASLFTVPS